MTVTYSPVAHTAPETAKVDSTPIDGLPPGVVYAILANPYAPTYVMLPTGTTSDGYPGGMTPFLTGTGKVT